MIYCLAIVLSTVGAVNGSDLIGIYEASDGPLKAHVVAYTSRESGPFRARIFLGDGQSEGYAISGERIEDRVKFKGVISKDGQDDLTVEAELYDGTLSGRVGDEAFVLERTVPESPTSGKAAPPEAIILYDGTSLEGWRRHPEHWNKVRGGGFQVSSSDLVTKQVFGDLFLHVEFRCPFMPNDRGQARGNSGVYLQGRYELQVLDSFGLVSGQNDCGSLYNAAAPLANACYPPLTWQTYDIEFRAPRFDDEGRKSENARITVRHNGVLIQDDFEFVERSGGGMGGKEVARGPLLLQDHRDSVQYRNIWAIPRS